MRRVLPHRSHTRKKARGESGRKDGSPDLRLQTLSQTEKKPPTLTAQTAASQQTLNFSSRPCASQPWAWPRPPTACCVVLCLGERSLEAKLRRILAFFSLKTAFLSCSSTIIVIRSRCAACHRPGCRAHAPG